MCVAKQKMKERERERLMEGQPNKRQGGDGWRGSRIDEALNLDCRGTLSLQLQEDRVELHRQMRDMKLKKHIEKQRKQKEWRRG